MTSPISFAKPCVLPLSMEWLRPAVERFQLRVNEAVPEKYRANLSLPSELNNHILLALGMQAAEAAYIMQSGFDWQAVAKDVNSFPYLCGLRQFLHGLRESVLFGYQLGKEDRKAKKMSTQKILRVGEGSPIWPWLLFLVHEVGCLVNDDVEARVLRNAKAVRGQDTISLSDVTALLVEWVDELIPVIAERTVPDLIKKFEADTNLN